MAARSTSRPIRAAALAYTQTSLTANAGSDTIDFNNPASLPHDVAIEDSERQDGRRHRHDQRQHDLDHGRPEARHLHVLLLGRRPREAGMEGTLTVK